MANFTEALENVGTATVERITSHLPQLLGALALLLVGWVLARLLRTAARRGAALLDALISRNRAGSRWRVGRSAALLGSIVYWVVLLFFVTAATHTLGLQTFTEWLARLLDHLPALAAGLLIVVAGYLLSGFVADLVQATATALAPAQRSALARLAQGATLVVALLVGADQMGFKDHLDRHPGGGAAGHTAGWRDDLAVSLGARSYVANLIGAHYLRQALRLGQQVRVAGFEGRIVDVSATSLVLETADGRVVLPAKVYHDEAIVVLTRQDGELSSHGRSHRPAPQPRLHARSP